MSQLKNSMPGQCRTHTFSSIHLLEKQVIATVTNSLQGKSGPVHHTSWALSDQWPDLPPLRNYNIQLLNGAASSISCVMVNPHTCHSNNTKHMSLDIKGQLERDMNISDLCMTNPTNLTKEGRSAFRQYSQGLEDIRGLWWQAPQHFTAPFHNDNRGNSAMLNIAIYPGLPPSEGWGFRSPYTINTDAVPWQAPCDIPSVMNLPEGHRLMSP